MVRIESRLGVGNTRHILVIFWSNSYLGDIEFSPGTAQNLLPACSVSCLHKAAYNQLDQCGIACVQVSTSSSTIIHLHCCRLVGSGSLYILTLLLDKHFIGNDIGLDSIGRGKDVGSGGFPVEGTTVFCRLRSCSVLVPLLTLVICNQIT